MQPAIKKSKSNPVLIFDREDQNVMVLQNMLTDMNYAFEYAISGEDALKKVTSARYSLFLIDAQIPELEGFRLVQELNKNELNKDVPAIFITSSSADKESILNGYYNGVIDIVSKPFDDDLLKAKIKSAIKTYEHQHKLSCWNPSCRAKTEKAGNNLNRLIENINYSKKILNAILPNESTLRQVIPNSFIYYEPKDIISGDFPLVHYDRENESIYIGAFDCSGHGIAGAMLSIAGNFMLQQILSSTSPLAGPAQILSLLHYKMTNMFVDAACINNPTETMDAALCKVDLKRNELLFCGAKRPMYLLSDGNLQVFKGSKMQIGGLIHNQNRLKETKISIKKDDKVFLFTDGLTDQISGSTNKKYTPNRLRKNILKFNSKSKQFLDMCPMFKKDFMHWKNTNIQFDDVLLIGVNFQ